MEALFKELTPKQRIAVEATAVGLPCRVVAEKAGVSPATVKNWLKLDHVNRYLKQLQQDSLDMIMVTKPQVVQMLLDAVSEAKLMSDPAVQIKGLREVGLMLGYYAPEEKRITYTNNEKQVREKISEMSEKELLQLASQSANVIEGDFRHVK